MRCACFKGFILLVLVLLLPPVSAGAGAEKWSFVAIGDSQHGFPAYLNVLNKIAELRPDGDPTQPTLDFAVLCGDNTPTAQSYAAFRQALGPPPPFLFPVRGNHENREDMEFILNDILAPMGQLVRSPAGNSVTYSMDWKNVRLIVLDPYSAHGSVFKGALSLKWLRTALDTPPSIDHIFLAMHEPVFLNLLSHWKLWRVLLDHRERVRGVFAAHTHVYHHERYPQEVDGIDLIHVGNAGSIRHSDYKQTIVRVSVEGRRAAFEVYQSSSHRSRDFTLRECWESGPEVGSRVRALR
ncbi:MAG: metallophosphoesterase [Syntrophobacteraceae bacterium]|nr:metallophosphoesterase [Syntrophobacteraceae bacterium]